MVRKAEIPINPAGISAKREKPPENGVLIER